MITLIEIYLNFVCAFFILLFVAIFLFGGLIFYEDNFVDDTIKYEIIHTSTHIDFYGRKHTCTCREPNKTKLYIALAEYIELFLFSDENVEMRRVKPENENVTD